MSSPSVLIAGAGPSGLILAIILLQSGVSVRIIDKELKHRIGSRGPGIQPRTLELYDILGIQGMPLQQEYRPVMARYRPGEIEPVATTDMVDWVEPTPDTPHPNPIYIPQEEHEAILRQNLQKLSCTVELGSELRTFEQSPDRVVAHIVKHRADGTSSSEEETATFDWLVGTDGAHSIVRKQLGLSFLGESLTESVALGDIVVEEGLEPGRFHIWSIPPKLIALRSGLKSSPVFTFAYTGLPASTPITRDAFIADFYALTGRRDVHFGAVTWTSMYRPSVRMVERMRVGRVFIAGDAAHTHTPAGGQGLNSSVQDAANLAWKLALACKSLPLHPPSPSSLHTSTLLLDSYPAERLRVIAQMLALTTHLFTTTFAHLSLSGKEGEAGVDDNAWKRSTDLRMLGVNYVGSPIVLFSHSQHHHSSSHSAAGAYYRSTEGVEPAYRAPDAPGLLPASGGDGAEMRLFADVFSASAHTVLIFGFSGVRGRGKWGKWGKWGAVVDAVGGCGIPAGCVRIVVVLPPGSGGWVGEAGEAGEAEEAKEAEEVEAGEAGEAAGAEVMILEDRAGHAYAGYGVDVRSEEEMTVVVVRPDGVVGAIVRDAEGVGRYFGLIFGIGA